MLHVIYDGQCAFCIRTLKVCRALDLRGALRFHDATDRARVLREFPELAAADLDHAMFVVTPGRRVTRGFFALRRIFRESPLMWPLLLPAYLPGMSILGPRAYALVARNRRRFGCTTDMCEPPALRDSLER